MAHFNLPGNGGEGKGEGKGEVGVGAQCAQAKNKHIDSTMRRPVRLYLYFFTNMNINRIVYT